MKRFDFFFLCFLLTLTSCQPVSLFKNDKSRRRDLTEKASNDPEQAKLEKCQSFEFFPALANDCEDRVMQLIEKDDSLVIARDGKGDTALHYASRRNLNKVFQYLVGFERVKINARGYQQRTPFLEACHAVHLELLRDFLEIEGLLLNVADEQANSCLHLFLMNLADKKSAPDYNHNEILELLDLLKDAGLMFKKANKAKESVTDMARRLGHPEVLKWLEANN